MTGSVIKHTAAIAFLASAGNAGATTIAVTNRGATIYVAADSLRQIGEAHRGRTDEVCKFIVRPNLIVAAAGILSLPVTDGLSLSLPTAVDAAATSPIATIEGRADAIAAAYRGQFERVLKRFWSSPAGEQYRTAFLGPSVQFAIVGADKGAPHVAIRALRVIDRGNNFDISVEPFRYRAFAVLGISDSFQQLSGTASRRLLTLPGETAVAQAVEAEIRMFPKGVGKPVNVMAFDSRGPRWVMQSAKCRGLAEAAPAPQPARPRR